MKLHRFYIPEGKMEAVVGLTAGSTLTLIFPELAHQMKHVLRLQEGEKVIFFNGDGNEYHCSLVSFDGRNSLSAKIERVILNTVSLPKEIFLFFSIIKKDNVNLILEKGTEIGVSHFIPIIAARSEKKDVNMERSTKIIIEAAEQCGRNKLPALYPVMKLENVFKEFEMSFIVLERGGVSFSSKPLKDIRIGLLIGPEGGWTEEEMEMLKEKGVAFRSLGSTTLRAETATIVGSAAILGM